MRQIKLKRKTRTADIIRENAVIAISKKKFLCFKDLLDEVQAMMTIRLRPDYFLNAICLESRISFQSSGKDLLFYSKDMLTMVAQTSNKHGRKLKLAA